MKLTEIARTLENEKRAVRWRGIVDALSDAYEAGGRTRLKEVLAERADEYPVSVEYESKMHWLEGYVAYLEHELVSQRARTAYYDELSEYALKTSRDLNVALDLLDKSNLKGIYEERVNALKTLEGE